MLVVCGMTVFVNDERYKGLTKTLDIPKLKTTRYMYYWCSVYNARVLKECISKGDGTPVQLEGLKCTDNMKRYRQSVPAFTYNTAVFPSYGDTKHHWYISTSGPYKLVSLIRYSKEEICNYINNAWGIFLHFVPLPDTRVVIGEI